MERNNDILVALIGNPNVGKSTLFNKLTGMHQHTGNWPGKTVDVAVGKCRFCEKNFTFVDLPGAYSLKAHSAEEEIARDFLLKEKPDATVVVCDATCLERNLNLALQVIEKTTKTVVLVNLLDEACKKKIKIDLKKLEDCLGVPVLGASARKDKEFDDLLIKIEEISKKEENAVLNEEGVEKIVAKAEKIAKEVVKAQNDDYNEKDRKIDKIIIGKLSYPIMLLLLLAVFWLTIEGSNYPSALISDILFKTEPYALKFFTYIGLPKIVCDALVFGVLRMVFWVVSVMLPPMAIFFPLFTLLEDVGFLPRIAFCFDKCFKKCSACGKQALTMCMGFGCNAAGVVGCRIIDSPRERLIAIITNNFVPCNGRFPTIISIISMFIITGASTGLKSVARAFILLLVIVFGVAVTLAVSKLLSKTFLRGVPSSFALELPPYRKPQIAKVLVRSLFDRTLFVLWRAVLVSAPAGLLIYLLANTSVGESSLLCTISGFLNPLGKLMGLDGVILLAFVLGFPANETVIPIMLMMYMSQGTLSGVPALSELKDILTQNGWTLVTAINVIAFSLFHFPCSTTLLTIKKETGSLKWTCVSFLLPTIIGFLICVLINFVL